jgi:Phage capsid family
MTTKQTLAGRLLEHLAPSPAERFLQLLEKGDGGNVLSGTEYAARLRRHNVNDAPAFQPEAKPDVYLAKALGGRIAPLCHIIGAVSDRIHVASEDTRTAASGPKAYGAALNQSSISFTEEFPTWTRLGSFLNATDGLLSDKGVATQTLDQFLDDDVTASIDDQLVNGDGSGSAEGTQFVGLLENTDVDDLALSGTRFASIVAAATTIRGAGFVAPLTVLVSAADALALLTDRSVDAGVLEYDRTVAELLGFTPMIVPSLADGTAIVGSLSEATALYVRGAGLTIDRSNAHDTHFLDGIITIRATTRSTFRVPRPTGVIRITSFS